MSVVTAAVWIFVGACAIVLGLWFASLVGVL